MGWCKRHWFLLMLQVIAALIVWAVFFSGAAKVGTLEVKLPPRIESRNAVPDYDLYEPPTKLLSREQQIKLMTECTQDAEQVAAHNPGEKYHLSSLMPITTIAVAFFEYRTR